MGETPEDVDVEAVEGLLEGVRGSERLSLLGRHAVAFRETEHLLLLRKSLPFHPNGLRFTALDASGVVIHTRVYYSVGGGFVVEDGESRSTTPGLEPAHPFHSGNELLANCRDAGLSVSQVMMENERTWRSDAAIRQGLLEIWSVMQACVRRGCTTEGILPGGLKVMRRAPGLYRRLTETPEAGLKDPLTALDRSEEH